jgi:hypothetical protein
MAFSDIQKLNYLKGMFKQRIDDVETLVEMVTLINNISPTAVKNFINNELEKAQQTRLADATKLTELADSIETLQTELAGI